MHIGQLSKRLYGNYSCGNNGLMLHQDEFLRPTNHELFPAGSGNVEIALLEPGIFSHYGLS